MKRHVLALAVISIAVLIGYGRSLTSYFCGYDDFAEVHRAQFEDSSDPWKIITSTHFGTPKYRPVQRGLSFVTWVWGGHTAPPFRVRNLAFHLLVAYSIYGIAWLMLGAAIPAAAAGLLFGIHPLAHQSVIVASWGVTAAYAFLFVSFFLFLYSLHCKRWAWPLAGAFLSMLLGLLTYEPVIVNFGFMALYLLLWWRRHQPLPRFYLPALALGAAITFALFAVPRFIFVGQQAGVTSPSVIGKNLVVYLGATLLPVDSLLANSLWGTPLPSEIRLTRNLVLAVSAVGVAVILACLALLRQPVWRTRFQGLDWKTLSFFAIAAIACLSPYLVFTPHASETYLYSPIAFYSLILATALWRLLPGRAFYAAFACVAALALSATLVRTETVIACADTAQKIVSQFPVSRWSQGSWDVVMATTPQEPPLHRYGIYGYHGLSTIDPLEPGMPVGQWAAQLVSGNPAVKVRVVEPSALPALCSGSQECYWVLPNGDLKPTR